MSIKENWTERALMSEPSRDDGLTSTCRMLWLSFSLFQMWSTKAKTRPWSVVWITSINETISCTKNGAWVYDDCCIHGMIRRLLRETMSFRMALSFRRLGLTALLGTQSRWNAKASDHRTHCGSPCALHSCVTLHLPCSKLEAWGMHKPPLLTRFQISG